MYFLRNLEDDKLEIHFSKPDYQAMTSEKKEFLKRSCLFSGRRSCWVSRGKLPSTGRIVSWLLANGFEDKGTEGSKLSFADQVAREQEKAADRADRMANRMDNAEKEADTAYKTASNILSFIPPGQPILVGHHSEKRHRRDLEKSDNAMRRSVEATEKAGYYANRLANAKYTAEGKKYQNSGYLVNRIHECETRAREIERGLQGKAYAYSEPKEITEKQREYWNEQKAENQDKLEYLQYCLSQLNVFDKNTLAGKTKVKINGRWRELVRANTKTVSVTNTVFSQPELQKKYALKYNYGQIQEAE